jgi:hypothetical protein
MVQAPAATGPYAALRPLLLVTIASAKVDTPAGPVAADVENTMAPFRRPMEGRREREGRRRREFPGFPPEKKVGTRMGRPRKGEEKSGEKTGLSQARESAAAIVGVDVNEARKGQAHRSHQWGKPHRFEGA